MPTPRQIIIKNMRERRKVFDTRKEQLFTKIFKSFFRLSIWFFIHDCFVCRYLRHNGIINRNYGNESKANFRVHQAIDLYVFSWLCILIVSYVVFFLAHRLFGFGYRLIGLSVFCCLLSIYRLFDIFAGLASLHFNLPYKTQNPIRALVLTFVDYLQIILIFSILYLCFGVLTGDCFNAKIASEFYSGFMNSIYFSLVTITTLGYGDFSPQMWLCKLISIAEVICGIVVIVVALQRVIALTQSRQPA
jgi:voltage-gated potassium channel Kch